MPKPPDRVQPQVYESPGTGGTEVSIVPEPADPTEDALQVAGVYLGEAGNDGADKVVTAYRESSELFFEDTKNAGAGRQALDGLLNAAKHRPVDQLVHALAEDSFTEFVYTGNRVDAIEVWTDAGKTIMIRREVFTYTLNKVTTVVTEQYDPAGAIVVGETMTETLTYAGNNVDSVVAVMS